MTNKRGKYVRISDAGIPMVSTLRSCPACRLRRRVGFMSQVAPFKCGQCGFEEPPPVTHPVPAKRDRGVYLHVTDKGLYWEW